MLRFGEDIDWFTRLDESGRALKRLDRISLIVRRHEANMTRGKSLVELHVVRALKKALDRSAPGSLNCHTSLRPRATRAKQIINKHKQTE